MKLLKAITLVVICIIIIICSILIINLKTEKPKVDIQKTYAIDIVKLKPKEADLSRYFSVEACIEKIIYFTNQKNSKAVYDLIDQEYISESQITLNNVLERLNISNIEKYKIKEIYELLRRKE